MKKKLAILAAITAIIISALSFTLVSCNNALGDVYGDRINLADQYLKPNGKSGSSAVLTKGDGYYIIADLGGQTTFNTIVLKESGSKISRYTLHKSTNEEASATTYEHFYTGDKIEGEKVCYVGETTARYIRLSIAESTGNYKLTDFKVFNVLKEDKPFRVTSYLLPENIPDKLEDFDADRLLPCTDIIFFSMAKLTENGEIVFDEQYSEEIYARKLSVLRDAMAKVGKPDINIILNLYLPYGDNNAHIYKMMTDSKWETIKNIKAFMMKHGFDGYDCDFEYPYSLKEHKAYNAFLTDLKSVMPDKILSIASQSWAFKFDKKTMEAIDRVELMTYDMFDEDGHHSAFYSTFEEVKRAINYGFSPSKIDIGLPFYSRPLNKYAHWDNYSIAADKLGRFENLDRTPTIDHQGYPLSSPRYFNSYQMISDKVAYAYDANIGGVMIWHMSADTDYSHPLSLFRAINETLKSKRG